MDGRETAGAARSEPESTKGPKIPVAAIVVVAVGVQAVAWNAAFHRLHGELSPWYALLSLFLSINLLICYWEACLYLRRDYIPRRAEHWRERGAATGRPPAILFLFSGVPLGSILSPTAWADVWAAYCVYDDAYTDRRSFGFNCDVGNGFATPAPSMILLASLTTGFLPATVAGVLGVALFWQWVYVTSLYTVSFYMSGGHREIGRLDLLVWVWAPNVLWVVVPMFGLYVSVRLILDGSYAVLGL